MSPKRLPPGTERTPTGYRSWVWVTDATVPAGGRNRSIRWKTEPTITQVKTWREDQRVKARAQPKPVPILTDTGFPADVLTYLTTVRAMPTIQERTRHMGLWIVVLGDIKSLDVTSRPIRAARDQWLTVGPKRVLEKVQGEQARWVDKPVPLSASEINLRLRALENFFTVMYPKAPNTVREVDEVEAPEPLPRGQTFALAQEILAFMPDVTAPKKGGVAEPGSLSRVRFESLLWTGLPAIQLSRLNPETSIDWIARTVLPPRRHKGKTSRRAKRRYDRPRPLLPQAIDALTRFFALGAQRGYPWRSLRRAIRAGIRAANRVRAAKQLALIPESLTVYQLSRHTFATELMRASRNVKAVQTLLGHSDVRQTERYAMAAVQEQTIAAMADLEAYVRRRKRPTSPGEVWGSPASRSVRTPRTKKAKKTKKGGAPGRN